MRGQKISLQLSRAWTDHSRLALRTEKSLSFPEADLASHVLRMCPYTWQDQYNLHEKGGAPTDIRSLLQSLEAIERVCGQEGNAKSNPSGDEKPSSGKKKGMK